MLIFYNFKYKNGLLSYVVRKASIFMDFYKKLYSTLESLRVMLDLDHSAWADNLGLTKSDYFKIYHQRKPIAPACIEQLAAKLHIGFDGLITGRFDRKAVLEHARGNEHYLPEQYTVAAFSKMRSVISILSYVTREFGAHTAYTLLRDLQVQPGNLGQPESPVNYLLILDTLEWLSRTNEMPGHLLKIGAEQVVQNKKSALGAALKDLASPARVYERMVNDFVSLYEKNCSYRIDKLTDTFCVVQSKTLQEAADGLKMTHVGSPLGCMAKAGILAATPGYIDLPHAQVIEKSCVFRGDDVCSFEVNFELAEYRSTHPGQKDQAASGNLILGAFSPNKMRSSHIERNRWASSTARSAIFAR